MLRVVSQPPFRAPGTVYVVRQTKWQRRRRGLVYSRLVLPVVTWLDASAPLTRGRLHWLLEPGSRGNRRVARAEDSPPPS